MQKALRGATQLHILSTTCAESGKSLYLMGKRCHSRRLFTNVGREATTRVERRYQEGHGNNAAVGKGTHWIRGTVVSGMRGLPLLPKS